MNDQRLSTLLAACRQTLNELEVPQPEFEFEIGFAEDYDHLLSQQHTSRTRALDEALDAARTRGRLMVSAEAGKGKTSLTARLLRRTLERRTPALRVVLRDWTPDLDAAWREARGGDARRMDLLLTHLGQPATTEAELRGVASSGACLVVVDGLNEVPAQAARGLPWVLDAFAARNPWVSIVLTDRFQRRSLPSDDWALTTITRVRDPMNPARPGLDNALLLDISSPSEAPASEATLLLNRVRRAAKLDEAGELKLAAAALELYARAQSRFFERWTLAALVGDEVVRRLAADGTLREQDDHAYFRHHLFHDVLAAQAVVREEKHWTDQFFDYLTFRANSFDAVGLALELIDEPELADEFVISVYDWNLYAAAYAVSRGRRLGTVAVTPGTELAMLAVLAERRWDPVAPTVQRVEDALRVFPTALASRLLEAANLGEVLRAVAEAARADPATAQWRCIFLDELPRDALVHALGGGALSGWMAANVLRRERLEERNLHEVFDALETADRTIRWRAAHVLGAQPTGRGVELLFGALADEWSWVRYGAIRSLVEIAARSEELREPVLRRLLERVPDLRQDRPVLNELERALQLRDPPFGWATAVEPLLEELFAMATTVPDQDHWRRVGHRVTASIRAARAAQAR